MLEFDKVLNDLQNGIAPGESRNPCNSLKQMHEKSQVVDTRHSSVTKVNFRQLR